MTQELIVIDDNQIIAALSDEDKLNGILQQVKQAATAEVFDTSTKAGIADCKSMAMKVAKTKTAIDAIGKDAVSDMKAQCKAIDSLRKTARDFLDELKAEVRKPVTELEEAAKKREDSFISIINEIKMQFVKIFDSEEEVRQAITLVNNLAKTDFEEFAPDADLAVNQALTHLEGQLAFHVEKAALAEQKAKLEEEQRAAELERAKANAAEAARMQAEADAQRKVQEANEERERAIRQAQEAEQRAKAQQEAKRQAEEDAKLAREADQAHRQACNREALEGLLNNTTLTEEQAKEVIIAIAKKQVKHISINY